MEQVTQQTEMPNSANEPIGFWEKNKLITKGVFISALALCLLIPQFFINNLVNERSGRQQAVVKEVSEKWAGNQTLAGPVVILPFYNTYKDSKGEFVTYKDFAYFMPEHLEINGELFPDIRRRTIFKVTVYNSSLHIKGNFNKSNLEKLNIPADKIIWNEAKVAIGISDNRGLQEKLIINWDNQPYELGTGIEGAELLGNALGVNIALSPTTISTQHSFDIQLNLKGAQQINFIPTGGSTIVKLKSSSPKPSFQGKYLANYKIGDSAYKNGFESEWKIIDLNRVFPQQWKSQIKENQSDNTVFDIESFGVRIMSGLDTYAQTQRAVKYALLVIFLTFLIYFFTEAFQKKSVHPIQYTLVGIALCLFYTLLLSIGEYTGFNAAYGIAFLATVGLIAMYTKSIFQGWKTTLLFTTFLSIIYLFIFLLIQLEDSALLVGSVGLFIILAAIMYLSQKIQWHKK